MNPPSWPLISIVDVPQGEHPGAFGAVRKYDVHTGVDLYTPQGKIVCAIEEGTVVAIESFTGDNAGSPWWENTQAVLIEGDSGVILYGELEDVDDYVDVGDKVPIGKLIGRVARVLKKDKGRPTSMLHVELYAPGTRESCVWELNQPQPAQLRDPTPLLLAAHAQEVKENADG